MPKMSGLDYYYNPALFGVRSGFANQPHANREELLALNIERNIAELAVNRFKWTNVPPEIDIRFIEMTLLLNGLCVFYWDRDYAKMLAVKASPAGYVNFMDWPIAYTIVAPGAPRKGQNGQATFATKQVKGFIPFVDNSDKDAVSKSQGFPMWPNYFRQPEIDTIRIYSGRLAKTDMTLEINTSNARQNKVVSSTTSTQLSMVNLARQIDEGVNVIQPKDSQLLENIGVLDLGVDPDLFDKLSILRTRWWNECMGLLGIDNANQDKKERLVSAEVGANDSQTDSMRFVALNARQQALEHINNFFGTNIEVEFNTEVEAMAAQAAANNGINPDDKGTNKPEEVK